MEIPKEVLDNIESEAKNRYGQLYGLSKGIWTADEMLKNIEGAFSAGARWVIEQHAIKDSYWQKRTEAAEAVIASYNSDDSIYKYEAFVENWEQLKKSNNKK